VSSKGINETLILLDDKQLNNIFTPKAGGVIPYQYWTAAYGRGQSYGRGLANGHSFVVFKSHFGKWLSINDWNGNNPRADRSRNGRLEKFRIHLLGGNQVAIKGWNNKWMSCQLNGNLQINRDRLGSLEKFYIYTTSSCASGLEVGDDCLAIKSAKFGKWVVAEANGDANCNRDRPGSLEKWFGWLKPTPWYIESIEFDLRNGKLGAQSPENLGQITCNNKQGSITRDCSRIISKTVAQTESYENSIGVGITVGTTFEAGVPFVAEGQISMELSTTYTHTWGDSTYEETKYEQNVKCTVPAKTSVVCKYVSYKAELDVPYTMHLTKPGGWKKSHSGVWHAVSTFDAHVEYIES
jgi:hypothetical protein